MVVALCEAARFRCIDEAGGHVAGHQAESSPAEAKSRGAMREAVEFKNLADLPGAKASRAWR